MTNSPEDPFTTDPLKAGPGARATPPAQVVSTDSGTAALGAPPPPPPGSPVFAANAGASKNWLGIASLVFGVIGGLLFAVIFGVLGINAVKRGEANNKGMSVAGLVLAGGWVLGFVALIAASVIFDGAFTEHNRPGDAVAPGQLNRGDCIGRTGVSDSEGTTEVGSVLILDCDEPHYGQLYWVATLDGSYPGEDAVLARVDAVCVDEAFANLTDFALDNLYVEYFYPLEANWSAGDNAIQCIVVKASDGDAIVGTVLVPEDD